MKSSILETKSAASYHRRIVFDKYMLTFTSNGEIEFFTKNVMSKTLKVYWEEL